MKKLFVPQNDFSSSLFSVAEFLKFLSVVTVLDFTVDVEVSGRLVVDVKYKCSFSSSNSSIVSRQSFTFFSCDLQ